MVMNMGIDNGLKLKTPFFSAPGGAGTKRMIIWFKLQVHGYLEAWLLVSIRVYKLKKSILFKQK